MAITPLDRLVRKEVSLGAIRERPVANNLRGLAYAPFLDVATDDVIFDYIKNDLQEGLAPARAEDAEAELAQKDTMTYGSGRAALVDWSLKTKYTASDISRYREALFLQQQASGFDSVQFPQNFTGRQVDDFNARVARDDAARKRRLDLRIEWLIMSALETGQIAYNDGKIKFTVDYGRPGGQQNVVPAGGLWNLTTCDPIGDLLGVKQYMMDTYGVNISRGILSQRIVNSMWKSSRFLAAVGMPVVGGTPNLTLDPRYLGLSGYTPEGFLSLLQQTTGITFEVYDAFWRSRPIGSGTATNNRFISDDKVILLPSEGDLGEIDDTQIGFAKTLTSPHPEGNWASGFYEWEQETVDPWLHVRGSGVKAFPIFPYMEYTYVLDVL